MLREFKRRKKSPLIKEFWVFPAILWSFLVLTLSGIFYGVPGWGELLSKESPRDSSHNDLSNHDSSLVPILSKLPTPYDWSEVSSAVSSALEPHKPLGKSSGKSLNDSAGNSLDKPLDEHLNEHLNEHLDCPKPVDLPLSPWLSPSSSDFQRQSMTHLLTQGYDPNSNNGGHESHPHNQKCHPQQPFLCEIYGDINKAKVVLIAFTSPGCSLCRTMEKEILMPYRVLIDKDPRLALIVRHYPTNILTLYVLAAVWSSQCSNTPEALEILREHHDVWALQPTVGEGLKSALMLLEKNKLYASNVTEGGTEKIVDNPNRHLNGFGPSNNASNNLGPKIKNAPHTPFLKNCLNPSQKKQTPEQRETVGQARERVVGENGGEAAGETVEEVGKEQTIPDDVLNARAHDEGPIDEGCVRRVLFFHDMDKAFFSITQTPTLFLEIRPCREE